MLLTNQQKCIMEILGKVGCIRRDQLLALLYGNYRERVMTMRPEHLTPMLRQLSGISHAVCVEDDVIRLITKTANPLLLESIDVMLEITGGCPLQFSIPTSLPALLCFLYGDELTAYYVAALTAEREPSFRRIEIGEKERLIWLPEHALALQGKELPDRQIIAQKQKDGTHRFFANKNTTL